MTKRGIYHNLNESEYAISNEEVAFFFSSTFYLGKFLEEYKEHRVEFRVRISRAIITTDMNTDFLADIHLYKEIEKRGFRAFLFKNLAKNVGLDQIVFERGDIKWQELHQFALVEMTNQNTLDWYEMHGRKLHELKRITG